MISVWPRRSRFLIFSAVLLALAAMIIFGFALHDHFAPIPIKSDPLSTAERAWLDAHSGNIRLAPSPYWEPMEFFDDNGNYKGLVADYMKLMEARLGFKFTMVRIASWYEVLEMAKKREVDVVSAAYDTPERRQYLTWSEPFLEIPDVIVTRKSWAGALTLDDMKGMRVGVTLAYAVADWLRIHHPQVLLVMVPNDLVGLRMVSFGEIDAMVAELPIATHSIEREEITNLRVAGLTGYSAVLSVGVRNDWPMLAGIMRKGLDLITSKERQAIYRKWINLGETPFYYGLRFWYAMVATFIGIVLIATIVFAWNLALRRKVNEKTGALVEELAKRQHTETALRGSEKRLATLIGNLPGMAYRHYIETEDRWPMDYISSGCYDLTGYPHLCETGNETEFFDRVVHPDDRVNLRQAIRVALARREPFRLTYRIITADGAIKWVWEQGVGIYSETGDTLQVEGFLTDITEFKNAEKALKGSRQLFQDLVLNSLVGIAIISCNRIVFMNPEQQRIFGFMPQDVDLCEVRNIHPEDETKFRHFLETAMNEREECLEPDFRVYPVTPGGLASEFCWVHCRASRIEYQGTEAILLNMMDVTRARELEQVVAVQDKMSSLGRVAAGIAHEIRNPLSGINIHVSAVEKLLRRSGEPDEVMAILEHIRRSSHNIETVIRRVLDFTKPGTPRFQRIDINQAIREAIGLCAVSLRRGGVLLSADLADEPLFCRADHNMLQRVVLNLLTNAAEAMKGLTGEREIHVRSWRAEGDAVIQVADSGPGVSETIREKIFDPFFTTKSDGTGIGLSLSRRIIMDHDGTLELARNQVQGAQFMIRIPLQGVNES